jgi:hypothetical protein
MPLPDKCAAQLPINAVVAEVDFGGGPVPIFPISGLTRWDEKAGLPRDAIRSQCSTCSRHNENETGYEKD